jgi:peptide/nickel transport system substrate-binding protein
MYKLFGLAFLVALFIAGCTGSDGTSDSVAGDDASGPSSDAVADDSNLSSNGERLEIRVASAFLPGSLDPASEGYTLIQRGVAETLTRVGHDQTIEPWLAESVELVEGATWEIVLRDGITFWDGEAVTSKHVVDALQRHWDEQPASKNFLPETTEIEIVDDLILRLTLPEPNSGLPHNLAAPQLVIHKMDDEDAIMTGPYVPVTLRADDELVLVSYDDYWGGTPPASQVIVQRVSDGNARELAVQAGDVDIITEASPESAATADGDVRSVTVDSTRVHFMILNHQQAPMDDPAVREAIDRTIDRQELNEVALGGLGGEITSIIPPGIGIETPDQIEVDTDRAAQILDEAGWETGDNGIRVKDGESLEFLLYTYPGRPELTPIAVSIQDQLNRIGFDVSIQEVDDIIETINGTDFQASMFSMNMLPTGDPAYALQIAAGSDGSSNYGNYHREEFDALLEAIQVAEPGQDRDALILQGQQMLADDHASVFLISAPRAIVYRSDRLETPELHPSEMYFVHIDLPRPLS